jgi:hypothetical protein
MRALAGFVVNLAIILGVTSMAWAGMPNACRICTCQNERIICLDTSIAMDVLEEEGVCGSPCASSGGFQSQELVDTPCEDLPQCDFAQTPTASPLWLSASALALVLVGGASMRRLRSR